MWMLGAVAVIVSTACSPKDRNFITGSSDFTSVDVAISPSSASIVEGDSAQFTTTVTLVPQGGVVLNGTLNVAYAFSDPSVAEINSSTCPDGTFPAGSISYCGYITGDSPGTTTLIATYTDKDHDFAQTTSQLMTITVAGAP
jgi:hypothetical protein